MARELNREERVKGAVWGHLVGDALGVPYEFKSPESVAREGVEFKGGGGHGQPAGTWSDDGGLMLALLDSLSNGKFDLEDQGQKALDWAAPYDREDPRESKYAPGGTLFDIGGATSNAMEAIKRGYEPGSYNLDESDNGNGSLMRLLPVALTGEGLGDSGLVRRAMDASAVTHGHPVSKVTCALYVLAADRLLAGETDKGHALDEAVKSLATIIVDEYDGEVEAAYSHVMHYPTANLLRGTGYVVDCFWSAWESFERAADYAEAVTQAVLHGNDTDTTSCVAGGLAGAYWGVGGDKGVPDEWLDAMRGKEIVAPILDRALGLRGASL